MIRRHVHYYRIESRMQRGHSHEIKGYTEYVIGTDSFHFHFFSGICTYRDHTHSYSGITGMPIKAACGHYHKITCLLDRELKHEHRVNGFSSEDIDWAKGKETGRAFT